MKALKTILVVLFLSTFLQVNAQSPEKQAKKLTDKMSEVMALSKAESEAVYNIQFARFKESEEIKKEFQGEPEEMKEKLKLLGNKTFNEMKNAVGVDKMKQWKEYQSNKNN